MCFSAVSIVRDETLFLGEMSQTLRGMTSAVSGSTAHTQTIRTHGGQTASSFFSGRTGCEEASIYSENIYTCIYTSRPGFSNMKMPCKLLSLLSFLLSPPKPAETSKILPFSTKIILVLVLVSLVVHLDTMEGQAATVAAAAAVAPSPPQPPSAQTKALLKPDMTPEDKSEEPERDGIIISRSTVVPPPAELPAKLFPAIVVPESCPTVPPPPPPPPGRCA